MKEDLKLDSIKLKCRNGDNEAWIYENKYGLDIFVQSAGNPPNHPLYFILSIATIRAYLRRLDKGRE